MATYDSYKDSGVKWLGQIPSHWDTGKMREFFSERKQLSQDGSETLLSVSEYSGITPSVNDSGENVSRSASLIGYKKCKSSDLIINIMLAWKRGLGISDYDGIVSPAYCVFVTHNINPHYANYLLRTDLYTAEFKRNSTGIIESRLRMYPDDFKNIICIHPPKREQEAIVAYLDKVTAEIDRAIEAQKKMIDALNERKQIIITHAVTRGLNPNSPLRDSGIDWLGKIPVHWEVRKLKTLCQTIKDGTHFSPNIIEEGLPYITATDIRGKGIDYNSVKRIPEIDFIRLQKSGCETFKDDVLIVKDGATTGRVGLKVDDEPSVTLSSVAMLRPRHGVHNLFLYYLMFSQFMQEQITASMAGAAMPRITLVKLSNFIAILPPYTEQNRIVDFIEDEALPFEKLKMDCESMISLLQERKQIIINEVVTGKKKVI